jgi:AGZA family xanthine/uracil permease-like MFS transporter
LLPRESIQGVTPPSKPASWLDRFFRLSERGSSVRVEILGGATTFVAMAYIIVVNPAILKFDGIPPEAVTIATILAAIFGSLLMGLYANQPLAVAPYMGENAFIAFTLAAMGISWQERLGTVFLSGLIFLIITLAGLRSWLANAVAPALKHSFAVGIGLFLAFIGLHLTGIVVPEKAPGPPVKLGDLREFRVQLAIAGFVLIALLMCLRLRGAILLGIVATGTLGYLFGVGKAPEGIVALPWSAAYSLKPVALQLDVAGVLRLSFMPILLTLFLVSFLDTLGTLIGVGAAGGLLDEEGNFPDVQRPMLVDAVSCIFSALVGTSTSGAYIESAAGVREGARTGLAAITTAMLFALALFFIPLVKPLQELGHAYGPALIAVGVLMLGSVAKIPFDDLTEAVPAFATIAMMVFTYNIANGLTAGLILHPLIKTATGRGRETTVGGVVLALLCLFYYAFGLPH